jgi:predicted nucleic acid-binding protein
VAATVFVDSGAWYALADPADTFHTAAVKIYPGLLRRGSILVTTNLVLAEAHALILHKIHQVAALQFLRSIHSHTQLDVVYAPASLHMAAEAILQRYHDQTFSLADAVSFAVMRERHITEAFIFDHHFQVAGFILASLPRT